MSRGGALRSDDRHCRMAGNTGHTGELRMAGRLFTPAWVAQQRLKEKPERESAPGFLERQCQVKMIIALAVQGNQVSSCRRNNNTQFETCMKFCLIEKAQDSHGEFDLITARSGCGGEVGTDISRVRGPVAQGLTICTTRNPNSSRLWNSTRALGSIPTLPSRTPLECKVPEEDQNQSHKACNRHYR